GTDLDTAAAIQRTLYTLAQAPLPELTKCGFPGFQTLSNWHLASLTHLLPLLLDLFCHLFYPFVGGASGCLPGLAFAFLCEPPERHVPPPFPRNWLGFRSRSASFGGEEVDAIEAVKDFKGAAHQRASHQRFQHPQGFGVADRLTLLRWYVARVNRLLYE